MSMRERIANQKLFTDHCEGLPEQRHQAKMRMFRLNSLGPDHLEQRKELISEILGKQSKVWIEPPFHFCYGTNIEVGDGTYINFNCNFVDDGKITIGERVLFGPAVTIATVGHPINPDYRHYMYAHKVVIEDNCWIGAGTTILPGVTIGKNTVIGAGSVVTKDIPENVVAVGNPCRVLREISEKDLTYYYKNNRFDEDGLID